jgi:hypothetical protein
MALLVMIPGLKKLVPYSILSPPLVKSMLNLSALP